MLGKFALSMTAVLSAVTLCALTAAARPVTIGSGPVNSPCSDMVIPTVNHELGGGPSVGGTFSAMEDIAWTSLTTSASACAPTDDPITLNTLVTITNNTGHYWNNLWFVADGELIFPPSPPGSFLPVLTNADMKINEVAPLGGGSLGLGFRIDNTGVNLPLTSESLSADLIFAPNETWTFIVQDWAGQLGITGGCGSSVGSVLFGSPGVGGVSCTIGAGTTSNASIVAHLLTVPEPGTIALFGLGLLGLGTARRRSRVGPRNSGW